MEKPIDLPPIDEIIMDKVIITWLGAAMQSIRPKAELVTVEKIRIILTYVTSYKGRRSLQNCHRAKREEGLKIS